jgi:hypothetical protein
MIRYRLDDLGWFQFEELIKSLLKVDIGMSVESWGGHGDLGRDAYCPLPLRYPDRSIERSGPFVFQAKFVQGANASSADWSVPLEVAVRKELVAIATRRTTRAWAEPQYYGLLTNCPLTSRVREKIRSLVQASLPKAAITVQGAQDICSLLDDHPRLRASFPEILGIRDIEEMLAQAVGKRVLERSGAAIEESRDLTPVFVPTQAYRSAWRILRKHNFVVLDGPPEMGKTAIARTIGLALLISNWEIIECRNPDDVFGMYDRDSSQLFVADDAFGRTEYDATLGRMWERDLAMILHRLDARHRLIWTTRKHILQRALREMDLTGTAGTSVPSSEVIVTADEFTDEEKARMLYRHAKTARLPPQSIEAIKLHADRIISDPHFTPERIRRLVKEVLPTVATNIQSEQGRQRVKSQVLEALRNPTKRMTTSFRKLPETHRFTLAAMLDAEDRPTVADLKRVVQQHRPSLSERQFLESIDDLTGTFIKSVHRAIREEGLTWIHPSYRDLVIDELACSPNDRKDFLRTMSLNGTKLALSLSGGESGARQFPLLVDKESWDILASRIRELASATSPAGLTSLVTSIDGAMRGEAVAALAKNSLSDLMDVVSNAVKTRWQGGGLPMEIGLLEAVLGAGDQDKEKGSAPRIDVTWLHWTTKLIEELEHGRIPDGFSCRQWRACVVLAHKYGGEFTDTEAYQATMKSLEGSVQSAAKQVIDTGIPDDPSLWTQADLDIDHLELLFEEMPLSQETAELSDALEGLAEEYKELASQGEHDDYEPPESRRGEKFDVAALFEDL